MLYATLALCYSAILLFCYSATVENTRKRHLISSNLYSRISFLYSALFYVHGSLGIQNLGLFTGDSSGSTVVLSGIWVERKRCGARIRWMSDAEVSFEVRKR
jgi:hypothetical protein